MKHIYVISVNHNDYICRQWSRDQFYVCILVGSQTSGSGRLEITTVKQRLVWCSEGNYIPMEWLGQLNNMVVCERKLISPAMISDIMVGIRNIWYDRSICYVNSLACARSASNLKNTIFLVQIAVVSIHWEIALMWMVHDRMMLN